MYHQSIVGGSGLLCPWFNPALIISDLGSASFLKSLAFVSSFFLKCFKAVIVLLLFFLSLFFLSRAFFLQRKSFSILGASLVVVVVLGTSVQAWFTQGNVCNTGHRPKPCFLFWNQTLYHKEGYSICPLTSLAQSGPFPPEPDFRCRASFS